MATTADSRNTTTTHPRYINIDSGAGADNTHSSQSSSKILPILALLPLALILLFISAITLVGTLIALALSTPLFLIFSPILVPAALAIAFAVAGFLTSGAFGLTSLSSITWLVKYLRKIGKESKAKHTNTGAGDVFSDDGAAPRWLA